VEGERANGEEKSNGPTSAMAIEVGRKYLMEKSR
jgi:hypothetical protein